MLMTKSYRAATARTEYRGKTITVTATSYVTVPVQAIAMVIVTAIAMVIATVPVRAIVTAIVTESATAPVREIATAIVMESAMVPGQGPAGAGITAVTVVTVPVTGYLTRSTGSIEIKSHTGKRQEAVYTASCYLTRMFQIEDSRPV